MPRIVFPLLKMPSYATIDDRIRLSAPIRRIEYTTDSLRRMIHTADSQPIEESAIIKFFSHRHTIQNPHGTYYSHPSGFLLKQHVYDLLITWDNRLSTHDTPREHWHKFRKVQIRSNCNVANHGRMSINDIIRYGLPEFTEENYLIASLMYICNASASRSNRKLFTEDFEGIPPLTGKIFIPGDDGKVDLTPHIEPSPELLAYIAAQYPRVEQQETALVAPF